jgi:2,3-bisphosphoglycerate-independent phosphoglycerate mutase
MNLKNLLRNNGSKIVMVVFDGLSGLPDPETGMTELESAKTPNLDAIAVRSSCGLSMILDEGITPGSGPGHFAIFGYDPLAHDIGRGVLEALGVGFELSGSDLAARGNFATMNEKAEITDRRGGSIAQEKNNRMCSLLSSIVLSDPAVKVFAVPGKEHRFALILRGGGLCGSLTETDPQITGVRAHEVKALDKISEKSAILLNEFIKKAEEILRDFAPSNTVLLRGFACPPHIENFNDRYMLKSAAVATYPMYKGIARLLGMEVIKCGSTFRDQVDALKKHYDEYDFFYIHIKETDSAAHAGDFARKIRVIEACDELLPEITALKPECLIITGDHSSPCLIKEHSFHPIPTLFLSRTAIPDRVARLTEKDCATGILGIFRAVRIMPLALGFAGRLLKYGA